MYRTLGESSLLTMKKTGSELGSKPISGLFFCKINFIVDKGDKYMTKLLYAALLVLFLAPQTFAEDPKAEAPNEENADCQPIMAKVEGAKAEHKADYKAKGKAFYTWKRYHDELNSRTYEATDEPLIDSVKKCEGEDESGKAFCKGVMKKYNEISPKEKAAKEKLDKAQAKSKESRTNYNLLLEEANDMNCLVKQ